MPLLAVLTPAADVRNGQNSALLHPHHVARAKTWSQTHIEASVAVQNAWVSTVALQSLFVANRHRNLRSILRRVKHLL